MPGFNQTGPVGQGPMTGRRMGKCTSFGAGKITQTDESNQAPENMQQGFGLGMGLGRGARGRGFRGRGLGQQNRFRGV
jgi:hypothetical protein